MKKALFVGINYYDTPSSRLNGCINDINNMSNILITKYGYSANNITKLEDTPGSDPNVLPTKAAIIRELTKLISSSPDCSELWFHYSGHGSQVRDKNSDETDRLDEVIVPSDYIKNGFITDDELFDIIKKSTCKTMLIFDSCHSESVCDLQWGFGSVNGIYVRKTNSRKAISNALINCLSGCKDNQTSADTYNSKTKQGVGAFTDTMLTCLQELNYKTNVLNLHKRICQLIQKNGYTQMPMLSSSSYAPTYDFSPIVTTQPVVISPATISQLKPLTKITNAAVTSTTIIQSQMSSILAGVKPKNNVNTTSTPLTPSPNVFFRLHL